MHKTLQQLRQLKLSGMAQALQIQQEQVGTYEGLAFMDRMQLLLDEESLARDQNKQQRLIRQAKFKLHGTLNDIDYQHRRNITQSQMAELGKSLWIERGQNLAITGPCGSGKTYLACALGHNACLKLLGVRYYRLSRLLLELTQNKAEGTYQKALKQIARTPLLIIDDWGLEPLQSAHRHDIMEIMDDRHNDASTIVISQLPVDQWYASIGDNTLADAILDRLIHNAHRLELNGESMRKKLNVLDPT